MATDGNRQTSPNRSALGAFGVSPATSLPRSSAAGADTKPVTLWFLAIVAAVTLLATGCRVGAVETEAADRATSESSTAATDGDHGGAADQNSAGQSDTATDDTAADDTAANNAASDNAASDDTAADNAASDNAAANNAENAPPEQAPSDLPRALTVSNIDCVAPSVDVPTSLNDEGLAMFERYVDTQPAVASYQLVVDVNPSTGEVVGAVRAAIPAQARTINFRFFAGMASFDAGLQVNNVTVNGESVDFVLDQALLSVPASSDAVTENQVELDFTFTIDQMAANSDPFAAFSGESLQPDQVGLLGRTNTGMQLGHWFPVWLPDGSRTDPDPSGFGDIGAFPAANICATITVPPGYQVVTSGSRVDTTDTSIVEAGAGLRDFSMLISNDLVLAARFVRGVEIRVWGPADDPAALMTVLDLAEQSHEALTDAFGPYPWEEIEIVSAPLGAGVGGMEWPGAVWIEQSIFAGGLPGMGDLGDLFGDESFGTVLEAIGGDALTTSLEWTVAHELAHEWWHATIGNDSIESPAVDEPLAQFSACVAMQRIHPDNWRDICEAQTIDQYAQARALGVPDAAAEQPSDRFESSLQYGAIIYGKAPGFYFAVADLIGWDALTQSLKSFVDENSFALVSTNTLRAHLVDTAGDNGPAVAELWDRWFREARGDEDIEPSDLLGGFEAFEGLDLGGLFGDDFNIEDLLGDDFNIEELLGDDFNIEELLGDDFNIEELLGDDFNIEELLGDDFNIEDLLGDDSELFDQLLDDFVENSEAGD